MTIYDQAVRYVRDYKWSVIPIRSDGSKRPALGQGEVVPFRSRYATDNELLEWFKENKNHIGIITGKLSGLSVVDVDGPNAPQVFSPINVKTNKGRHHYFRYQEGLSNDVRPYPDMDFRTEGGYCVSPPSSGYYWGNPSFTITQLPNFPVSLIPVCSPSKERILKVNPPGWFGEAIKNLKEGNRNATFTKLVGRLHGDNYLTSDILALLSPIADAVGFPAGELITIINSISQYKNSREGTCQSIDEFLQDMLPVEWLVPQVIAKGALHFVAGLPETYKTWMMLDLAIETARGGGKWLGKFSVKGGRVLVIDQERFKGELQRRLKALLRSKGLQKNDVSGLFARSGSTTRLDIDDSYRAFRNELTRLSPDMVIIDSYATIQTGNENNRQETQKVLERVKEIRDDFGCAVIFIDHETKSVYTDQENQEAPSAYRMVGSVGKPAAADVVLTVRKHDANTCTVYQTKNNLAPKIDNFNVVVRDTTLGVEVSCD